ncbi:MAG: hypothetical protein LUG27_02335 [Clostridiales bacterium]|nr:hypothetical protein [Clostridiales bacterium]
MICLNSILFRRDKRSDQYTLACDGQCNDLGKFFNPHHPAVLRVMRFAADAAYKAGIWIGLCGELGAGINSLPTFLAIGVSMNSVYRRRRYCRRRYEKALRRHVLWRSLSGRQ